MFIFATSAFANITRTEAVFYDLSSADGRTYTYTMTPALNGMSVRAVRNDNSDDHFSGDITLCTTQETNGAIQGRMSFKKRDIAHSNPAFFPYMNFTDSNQLRVVLQPLSDAQYILLDQDTQNIMVVDPSIITLNLPPCRD